MRKVSRPSVTQIVVKELYKYLESYEEEYLPSEIKLAELLGVSRLTVREAVSIIETEGFVTKQQGRGTLVNKYVSRLGNRIDIDNAIEKMLKDKGHKVNYTIEKYHVEKNTEDSMLEGEDILFIEKHLFADDNVVAIYIDKIPMQYFMTEVEKNDFVEYIFPIVEKLTGQKINTEVVKINPVLMTDHMQKVFDVKEKLPMICYEVAHYSTRNNVLMTSTEYYTGKLIDFYLVRSARYR